MPAGRLKLAHAGRRQSGLKALSKKVNKNTRILGSREKNNIRVTMDTSPDTTAVVQNLAPIAEGLGDTGRIALKIHAESIDVMGSIFKSSTAIFTRVRMIIVIDRQGDSTPPTVTNIFEDENDFFTGQNRREDVHSMKRFRIIWDKFIILNEAFDGQVTCKSFKFHKKLNHNMNFSGAGATDEGKNSIWLITGSDEATNVPTVNADAIFRYTDI